MKADTRAARSRVGSQTVSALRTHSTLLGVKGEIDTGRQKESYVFAMDGDNVEIGNFARSAGGYPYPRLNERRYRIAERTIRRHQTRIVRLAQRDINAGLREYRGSLRRARLTRG